MIGVDKKIQTENHSVLNEKVRVTIPALAMGLDEAAAAIGICSRTLWEIVQKGEVPHFKIGRRVMFGVDALREWVDKQTKLFDKTA